jgi:hypothetical protein
VTPAYRDRHHVESGAGPRIKFEGPAPVPSGTDCEILQAGRVSNPDRKQDSEERDLLVHLSVHDVLLFCCGGAQKNPG